MKKKSGEKALFYYFSLIWTMPQKREKIGEVEKQTSPPYLVVNFRVLDVCL